jgi:hypothetical protein
MKKKREEAIRNEEEVLRQVCPFRPSINERSGVLDGLAGGHTGKIYYV